MKKEAFELLKKELQYVALLFLLALAIFKVAFYNEALIALLKNVAAIFWLFVLPGYFIMLYWNEKLDFAERLVIGIGFAAAIIGIFSYYLGLAGLNIRFHTIVLPLVMIGMGLIINLRKPA